MRRYPNQRYAQRLCPYHFYLYCRNHLDDRADGFIFFPELILATSLAALFPELYFYP